MKSMKANLFFLVICFFCFQGSGLAETMYVTDRLYLSLRSVPDAEQPAMTLLPSDAKVEVLEVGGDWAKVKTDDGKTGWVMKRFLVEDLPKSFIIEDLKRQIEKNSMVLESLRGENASLKNKISYRILEETEVAELQKKIKTLENQIVQQDRRLEMATEGSSLERMKEIYITGIAALFAGIVIGYVVRRPKKKQMFSSGP